MKKIIKTNHAPDALGPYSQGVKADCGTVVYTSGQIGIDPQTKQLAGTTAAEQCRQVMENLKVILVAGGADLSHVVKTTIFLVDIADFAAVNEVYGEYFDDNPPARATIQAAALPMGALVEIDAIAVVCDSH
ncbi:MAG: RidA family protein [candidate division Zixibacteria bacterium]|nr:RidA family protein [candidate division Zixibacteria bacterium]